MLSIPYEQVVTRLEEIKEKRNKELEEVSEEVNKIALFYREGVISDNDSNLIEQLLGSWRHLIKESNINTELEAYRLEISNECEKLFKEPFIDVNAIYYMYIKKILKSIKVCKVYEILNEELL